MNILKVNIVLFFLFLLVMVSCQKKHEGTIEGSVRPPAPSVTVTAVRDGKTILAILANAQDGNFRLPVPAGIYTINVIVPDSPYPLSFHDITVKPGQTTVLPPIALTPAPVGKSVLSGRVKPPRPDTEVKLIYEGKERAAVHTDREGKYEFKELPAGTYLVQANLPGHADDAAQVVVPENQKVEQNAVLLPISSIDGVDWAAGKIRAAGIGLPPQHAENDTVRREMTKRAALADAQRNLLKTIEQIKIDAHQNVRTAMTDQVVASRIQGFIKGYTVVREKELDGGKYELILELPLNGPSGLSRLLSN
jgi:hypothetical protein